VHGLRIVIDHLPHAPIPAGDAARKEYEANLRRLGENPDVFVKLSEIPVVMNGKLIRDPGYYRAPLDAIWNVFGEDHILFGSDWPNSDHVAPFADTISIVREYISGKPVEAAAKYFWKNSLAAYKWHPRRPDQPRAV
jgi:L-fuconolactonase